MKKETEDNIRMLKQKMAAKDPIKWMREIGVKDLQGKLNTLLYWHAHKDPSARKSPDMRQADKLAKQLEKLIKDADRLIKTIKY